MIGAQVKDALEFNDIAVRLLEKACQHVKEGCIATCPHLLALKRVILQLLRVVERLATAADKHGPVPEDGSLSRVRVDLFEDLLSFHFLVP